MKFCLSTLMFLGRRLDREVIRGVAAAGITRLELFVQRPHFDPLDAAQTAELRAALEESGVEVVSTHAPIYRERLKDRAARKQLTLSLSDPDTALRELSIRELEAAIDACGAFGAPNLVVHTGLKELEGAGGDAEVARYIESLHGPAVRAKEKGVTLALENGTDPGVSVGLLVEVLRRLDAENVGICLDVGHSNLYGNPHADVRQARPYLSSLHLHDNEGTDDLHLLPGRGTVDFRDVIGFLRRSQFIGIITMEVGVEEGADPDSLESLCALAGRVTGVIDSFERGLVMAAGEGRTP
jgi:sugar phosphate isomerase/epimerase